MAIPSDVIVPPWRASWLSRWPGLIPLAAVLVLMVAAGGLWLTYQLPYATQLILAVTLVFSVTIALVLNWQRLLGPVFVYDVMRTARQGRGFTHRFLYGCLLCAMLILVFSAWAPSYGWTALFRDVKLSPDEAPRFAWSFFVAFLAVQFAGVLIITPAYTAGAIAQEKERRTLEFLLVTDLSNREIVLGMLAARLANLFLIILTGLPVFCLIQVMGGVEPPLIFAGFVATLMTMLSVGSLSILVSVHASRPLPAVLMTYLWLGAALSLSPCIPIVNYSNPVVSLFVLGRELDAGKSLGLTLFQIVLAYFVFHGLAAAACCLWAIRAVRDAYLGGATRLENAPVPQAILVATPAKEGEVRLRRILVHELGGWGPYPADDDKVVATTSGWGPLPEDEAAAPRSHRPPPFADLGPWPRDPVGDDGLLWKETGGNYHWLRGLTTLCRPMPALALAAAFAVLLGMRMAIDWFSPGEGLGEAINPLVRGVGTVVFCSGLLVVALNAAGRVSREREQRTLDSLRITPLASAEILFAKWLASIWSVRALGWFFLVVWGFGVLTGGLHVTALPLLLGAAAVYYSCLATVGLWFSTAYRTSLRATLFTVLAALVLVAGPGLFGKILFGDPYSASRSAPDWDERLVTQMLSPPLTLWALAFQSSDLLHEKGALPMLDIAAAVMGLHFYLLLTVILWASLLSRFDADKGPPALPEMTKSEIPNDERMTKSK